MSCSVLWSTRLLIVLLIVDLFWYETTKFLSLRGNSGNSLFFHPFCKKQVGPYLFRVWDIISILGQPNGICQCCCIRSPRYDPTVGKKMPHHREKHWLEQWFQASSHGTLHCWGTLHTFFMRGMREPCGWVFCEALLPLSRPTNRPGFTTDSVSWLFSIFSAKNVISLLLAAPLTHHDISDHMLRHIFDSESLTVVHELLSYQSSF